MKLRLINTNIVIDLGRSVNYNTDSHLLANIVETKVEAAFYRLGFEATELHTNDSDSYQTRGYERYFLVRDLNSPVNPIVAMVVVEKD